MNLTSISKLEDALSYDVTKVRPNIPIIKSSILGDQTFTGSAKTNHQMFEILTDALGLYFL